MSREAYVVYASYKILTDTIIKAYSPAEAKHIMMKRMQGKGMECPEVDMVTTYKKDRKLNSVRDHYA